MPEHFETLVAAGRLVVHVEGQEESIATVRNAAAGDVEPLVQAAEAHGMAPILRSVLAVHATDVMSGESSDRIARERQLTGARTLAAIAQLSEAMDAFDRAEIRALPYKGPLLSLDAYGDAMLRSSDDLDLLVDPRDVDRAWEALRAIGYRVRHGWTWRRWRAANAWQGQVSLHAAGDRLTLDLHWRTCDVKLPWNLPIDDLLARSRPIEAGGRPFSVPGTTDQLLLVLLHAARHGWDRLEPLVCAAALRERGVDTQELSRRLVVLDGVGATNRGLELMERVLFPRGEPASHDRALSPKARRAVAQDVDRLRRGDAGDRRDAAVHLGALENLGARGRYVALAAMLPTVADYESVRLPESLEFLYPLVRLGRLATR